MVYFPKSQAEVTFVCAIVGSSISCLGCLFVIITYWKFPVLQKFPFRMVAWLAFADMGVNFAFFLGDDAVTYSFRCYLQAITFIYFNLSSVFLSAGIAYMIWLMLVDQSFDLARARELRVYLVCFGVPILFTALPLTTADYGNTGAWCSITGDPQKDIDTGSIWMLVCFYIPLWLCIAYICWAYFQVYRVIQGVKKAFQLANYTEEKCEEMPSEDGPNAALSPPEGDSLAYSRRLFLYPLVIVVCYCFATINKVYMLATGEGVFTLYLLEFTFLSLSGFGDALVYGATSSVRNEWKKYFRRARKGTWKEISLISMCMGSTVDDESTADPSQLLPENR